VRSLAELYTQKMTVRPRAGIYDRIKNSEMGNDPSLDTAIANTIVRRFDHQIADLNPFGAEHAARWRGFRRRSWIFKLPNARSAWKNIPTDLAIRFEMGQLYFQAGKIGEAISGIAEGAGQPAQAPRRHELLAQCFAKRKMFDLAARTLQNAIKEKLFSTTRKRI
jgi:hypothetical protein